MSTAYIVDDDAAIRDALMWLLKSRSVRAKPWPSAEAFLEEYSDDMRGCLLLDIRMNGMTGMDLMDQLRARACRMPIIFLTGHGDVGLAVSALKRGAYDFIEKPFNDNNLVDRILEALDRDNEQRHEEANLVSVEGCLRNLTKREHEVMERVLAGKLNKIIADELGIATRTVEVHRSRLFDKMGVKSAVELAQLLARRR